MSGGRAPAPRSVRARLRGWGPYRRARRLLGRTLARLSVGRPYAIYRKDLRRPLPEFRPGAPVRIAPAGAEQLDEVARINPAATEALAEVFRERLAGGHRCFVARVDGEIVGWNWSCFGSLTDLDGQMIGLAPGEVYTMDAFTAERWRGRGIHTALLLAMLDAARSGGCATAYTQVNPFRRRSAKGVLRLGWERSGLMLQTRGVLGLRPRIVRLWGSLHPITGLDPARRGW